MNFKNFTALILLSVILTFVYPGVLGAAVSLPDGFLISDENDIKVSRDGAYFIYADNVRPGDTFVKVLQISNLVQDTPFRLTLSAIPGATSGPIDLLDKINLQLTLNSQVLYDGRVYGDSGINMIDDGVDLGLYAEGDSAQLIITLKMADDIDPALFTQKSIAEFEWKFSAVRDADGGTVKTGDTAQTFLITLCILMIIGICFLLILRKRRTPEKHPKSRESDTAVCHIAVLETAEPNVPESDITELNSGVPDSGFPDSGIPDSGVLAKENT
jgi:hypothetical protein